VRPAARQSSPSLIAPIVFNCTVSNDSASFLGGVFCTGTSGSATVGVGNSIFKAGASGGNFATAGGTISSFGHNISNVAAGGDAGTGPGGLLNGSGEKRNTNPLLDASGLKNNGGPTKPSHFYSAVRKSTPGIRTSGGPWISADIFAPG